MKSFIISIICIALLLGSSIFFESYSDKALHEMATHIENTLLIEIESEDWDIASKELDVLKEEWENYRKKAIFFLSRISLNEASYAIEKAERYVKAKDVSNSSGELAYLKEFILDLHSDESFNVSNIF